MGPLIALTGRPQAAGKPYNDGGVGTPRAYLDALEAVGAVGAVLAPVADSGRAPALLARFDGLLLTGGPDVDPHCYGQDPHPQVYGADSLVDHFEMALARAALEAGVPVLAICRGLQVLNVALGGSLQQHLGDRPRGGDHGQPGGIPGRSTLAVEPSSLLGQITGVARDEPLVSLCTHHQAVAEIGRGLVVTARAADGVVEGLELAEPQGRWLLAVQWHPEKIAQTEAQHRAIFEAFSDACGR